MGMEAQSSAVDLKWLGLRPSHVITSGLNKDEVTQEMGATDLVKLRWLLNSDIVKNTDSYREELEYMLASGKKYEIEALHIHGINYLSDVYLPERILNMDYI